jgi:hypothetical protein
MHGAEDEEPRPAQGRPAEAEMIADLSEAIDALLGVLTMVQEQGLVPDDVMGALDDLVTAAERAASALEGVASAPKAAPSDMAEDEHRPARPILKVPMHRGAGQRAAIIRAHTPNYGAEEL